MSQHTLIQYLNSKTIEERQAELHRCCGSTHWSSTVAKGIHQSNNDEELLQYLDTIWLQMEKKDIMEAFSHHPQIGADPEQLKKRFQHTHQWSANEQAGMNEANEEVIRKLAQGNKSYLEKFGYIFIVCASGKTAQEMLSLLEERLGNDPADELVIAAGEQAKITKLRLKKLIEE